MAFETRTFKTREEAEKVMNAMVDVLKSFDVVSVGDLNTLCGEPSVYKNELIGWTDRANWKIVESSLGHELILPTPKSLV